MTIHTPVLLKKTLDILKPASGLVIIDATFGGGGHTTALAQKGAAVYALDRDPVALKEGERLLSEIACPNPPPVGGGLMSFSFPGAGTVTLIHQRFGNIDKLISDNLLSKVDAVLFDLGLSTDQINSERGFSFQRDNPLDMRFDPETQSVTAADLLKVLTEKELGKIFYEFSDESYSHILAKEIVQRRKNRPFETTFQLVELITQIKPNKAKIHPATKIFQSLRIAVNSEFEELKIGLENSWKILSPGGKILVISYHSGEDRIVKRFALEKGDKQKPINPDSDEIKENPNSKSAKLRVISKN